MTAPRLSMETLPGQHRLAYDRHKVRTGIIHLGTGAFHRAHQAVYVDDVLAQGDAVWGILGVSLRSAAVRDQLVPQDGLYTVLVRDGEREDTRIIGSISHVMVAPEDPRALIEALASPDIRIVTLTITEKGYKLDPASGNLSENDPDLAADYLNPEHPRTAPGLLYAALALRHARHIPPFTVLSCDNLPHNGARTRAAVLSFAERIDPMVADWIAGDGAFPSSMVDRIVPSTQPEDIAALAARAGYTDQGMVKTEPFTQWVIEDDFRMGRPDFESVGVQMTRDVTGWETAKLRLLNGAHSSLAYLGGIAGLDFMHECIAEPAFRGFLDTFWDEASSTLAPVPGLDVTDYRRSLQARFGNAALQHRTHQIAMDGSQKLPQRLLGTLRDRLAAGRPAPAVSLGIAAWMLWQRGYGETGRPHTVEDPLTARLTRIAADAGDDIPALVRGLMAIEEIFDKSLAADTEAAQSITQALQALVRKGAKGASASIGETQVAAR
ncbi:MAG: mannitol dehydrogenase family protein [Hyphomonas sp.]